MEVFAEFDKERAEHVRNKYKQYAELAESLEKSHYERLFTQNQQTLSSSEVHLELLGLLNSVNRHATNIARILVNWQKNKVKKSNKMN
jgi:Na+/phosphate symporter